MSDKIEKSAEELRVGAYDLHVHSSPSVFARAMDGMELVRDADACGMAGVMLKSHYEPTALRAEMINKYSGCKAKAYGGIALNWPVGGLNVYAVHEACKAGAKIVWMPTRDSARSLEFGNMPGDFFDRPGITIFDENGSIKPEVYDIMDTVKQYDRILATGHLSTAESIALCKAGRERNVRMILTHPEFSRTLVAPEIQKELADLGVLIEKNWYNICEKSVTAEQMVSHIKTVGVSRCYIATDRGQAGCKAPAEAYKRFIMVLLEAGLTQEEIYDLSHSVPKTIVE